MKNTVKKLGASLILFAVLVATTFQGMLLPVGADVTVHHVSTAEEFNAAAAAIKAAGAGEYVVDLQADMTVSNGFSIQTAGIIVTLIGNGHTLTLQGEGDFYVANGAVLNLGDGVSELTVKGTENNDAPGIVYVKDSASVCNMYSGVTLKDHKSQNYYGGGVTVEGGTFHMYGGTIENCGIEGGSVCYGGGAAVVAGGTFIMDDGTITGCYAESDYIDGTDPNRCFTAIGGGVYVSDGSSFTMNGGTISNNTATNFGGGVALDISYGEMQSYGMGNPKSTVTINGGTISGNTADCGAGVFASGYFYSFSSAIATAHYGIGTTPNPGLYINGGEISSNAANDAGGGVFLAMLRPAIKAQIHNAEIKNNTADNGAGVEVFGYWTKTDLDGCTITGNTSVTKGGGLALISNSSGGETTLKNTVIENNNSGDRGAGVYYDGNSKLTISGNNSIQNNRFGSELNNLNIFSASKPVYIGGALTGSQIGVSDPTLWDDGMTNEDTAAVSTGYLTSGYQTYNAENPFTFFTSDHNTWKADVSNVNTAEIRLVRMPYEYLDKVTLTKTYNGAAGYDNAGTPIATQNVLAEDVTFTIEPYKSFNRETGKTDIPSFAETSYTISAGDGSDFVEAALPSFAASNYGIGEYWYKVKENAGATAGVGYDTAEYYLHVVVSYEDPYDPASFGVSQVVLHKAAPANDGSYSNDAADKVTGLTNTYGAGSLTVTKNLTGNMADLNKSFEVTVVLTAPTGKTVTGPIQYGSNTIAGGWIGTKQIVFNLKNGESAQIQGIPDGVTYTVTETDYSGEGYDIPVYSFDHATETGDTAVTAAAWAGNYASGAISDSADTVTIENKKDALIDVGVMVDNAPYVLMIALVLGLSALIFVQKRKRMIEE